ncbi:Hypothetical protein ORPV_66 [Orpheovirus IHUMI-LCC2]|uniref:Uncharacterized protein n=1 Tax=Orpheovirus IHUMI-LCC2 TaxID=2023057 RepID=A0A2I2L384_9VIRU|nr:Hypothetical protein ORPV_66 [Orpheovirus IHUMI-LCC2]SNW61970.1 Hypothetical protein ORPV_66 [Orpheovirus IHUMI-LCC2]
MEVKEIANDNIREVFDYLSVGDIINYCNSDKYYTQLCSTKAFKDYFINKYFPNENKNLLYNIPINDLLIRQYIGNNNNIHKLIMDNSYIVRNFVINKYLGNIPGISKLSNEMLLAIMDILYPSPDNERYYLKLSYYHIAPSILRERLHTSFRLKYDADIIEKLYNNLKNNDIYVQLSREYINLLCIYFDRKDVYIRIFRQNPSTQYLENYDAQKMIVVRSNYLTYTDDDVSNVEVIPEFLTYSDNPIFLFQRFTDKFLQNEKFRLGYEGVKTNDNENIIGYSMRMTGTHTNLRLTMLDAKVGNTSQSWNLGSNKLKELISQGLHPLYVYTYLDTLRQMKNYDETIDKLDGGPRNILGLSESTYYHTITAILHKFINNKNTDKDIEKLSKLLHEIIRNIKKLYNIV